MGGTQVDAVKAEGLVLEGLDKVADVARFLSLSRSAVYSLMARGELAFVKLGKARRVPKRAVIELAAKNLTVHSRS
jgi:excisionase family DNA binding protein